MSNAMPVLNMLKLTLIMYIRSSNAAQVYVYNERVVQGGVRPSLVNLLVDVASRFDNTVGPLS